MRSPGPARLSRVAVVAAALALASPARADGAAARAFSEGTAAYERGDFLVAARSFDEAHAIAPAAAAVYNAARAWQDGGDGPRAADRYAVFLEIAPADLPERVPAKRELARLRRELVTTRIEGPPGTTVHIDQVEGAAVPVRAHLRAGLRTGTWREPGGVERRFTVDAPPGAERVVLLEAPALAPPAPIGPGLGRSSAAPLEAEGGGVDGLAVAGGSLLALGGVAVGVGIGVGAAALGARDDFVDGGRVDADLRAQADDLRTASNVTWVSGAAVGTIGLVLLVTSLTRGSEGRASAARPLTIRF